MPNTAKKNSNNSSPTYFRTYEEQASRPRDAFGLNCPKLSAALAKAAINFSVAVKDSTNPFYKSKYSSLSSVYEAIWEALVNEGLVVMEEVRGLSLYTILRHSSGEYLEFGPYPLPSLYDSPQEFGKAITYARRYSIMPLFGVTPEDDDGNAAQKVMEDRKTKAIKAINGMIDELEDSSVVPSNWQKFSIEELRLLYSELQQKQKGD